MFEHQPTSVYRYVPVSEVSSGDVSATVFEESEGDQPLAGPGSSFSGEGVELLQGGPVQGVVLEIEEDHYQIASREDAEKLEEIPEPLDGLGSFLTESRTDQLLDALAETMDLALIEEQTQLHDELRELFLAAREYKHNLKQASQAWNNSEDPVPDRVLEQLDQLERGGTPEFRVLGDRRTEHLPTLCDLHRERIERRDQAVEFFQSWGDELRRLIDRVPSVEELRVSTPDTRSFVETVRDDLITRRTNDSPFEEFRDSWAREVLIPPAIDEGDWTMTRLSARLKQILENFLYRGVFLERRADYIIKIVENEVADSENLYQRLTFPTKEYHYLLSHILNVLILSLFLANRMDLPATDRRRLGRACLLFDIGMLRIPPESWVDDDQPEPEEVETIKRHPNYSLEWLDELPNRFSNLERNLIQNHHERLDGSGYPNHLDQDDLSRVERVLIVADVYDAMSTSRPHRPAINPDKILTYLKNREQKFDDEVVQVIARDLGPYPPGTVVQLTSNEIGVTTEGGSDPAHPRVKVIIGADGGVYDNPKIIDLNEDEEREIDETIGSRNTPNALLKYLT